ncbi:MAG: AbrB/MazE/SpoVT family DNA-binding domain-containing protein, partial [Candidatus Woesearchaeota archaeon]
MQRKIIKQGNNSYTVTLPKKWIDKNGIGDFVFVEEIDNSLYIKASELIPVKLVNVDTPIDNASRFRTLLAAIYRRGFSRVTFTNIILSRVTILSVLSSFQSGSSLNPKSATEIEIEFSDSRDSSFVEATINRLFFITELLFTAQKSEVEYLKAEAIKLRDYALRLIHINNYG